MTITFNTIKSTDQAPERLQRAQGRVCLSFKQRDGHTVIKDMYQQGSAKVRLPRQEQGRLREAVLINTSGGMTDHDQFECDVIWEAETCASVTTQAAERIYRSRSGPAIVQNHLSIHDKALALWLPQETILFDQGCLKRSCTVTIEKGGELLACESTVFGRTAMREQVKRGSASESWTVRYNKTLVFADHICLDGKISEHLQTPALAGGSQAWATILFVSEKAGTFVETVRRISAIEGAQFACSLREPVLIIRILGRTGAEMRLMLTQLLEHMLAQLVQKSDHPSYGFAEDGNADKRHLPRVWYC